MTDEELLERWREGDNGAGDELVNRHFGAVFGFFRTKLPELAEDLTQPTFLACVESRDRIDAGQSTPALRESTSGDLDGWAARLGDALAIAPKDSA